MSQNDKNKLKNRITDIKVSTEDFLEKEDISDLTLFHLLGIFLYRKGKNMAIFTSLEECIEEKAEDKEILLYLFLNTLAKENAQGDLLAILVNESKEAIEQQINNFSSSELPEPSLYKGWGFRFSEAGISEKDNELHIKIDDIFEGSKLKKYCVGKDNTIIIENPENFKNDDKFDIGKIAKHIRIQESLTAKTSDGEEVKIEQGEKTYFYQDEEKGEFMAFSIKGISIEEAKNQEAAILAAHERVKNQLQNTTPIQNTTTPTQDTTTPIQNTTTPTNEPANPTLGGFGIGAGPTDVSL